MAADHSPDGISLALFQSRCQAVCDEMGAVLRRAALSPNIKDRLDFSCALFGPDGDLFAQAAHIPVHLGSMAFAMGAVVERVDWQAGDLVVFNDPFLGGTHLPDVTVVAPLFVAGTLVAFVANRAHHANIGAASPGSMPVSSSLEEEGVVFPPCHLLRDGRPDATAVACLQALDPELGEAAADPGHWAGAPSLGDFAAQASACRAGVTRLRELVGSHGVDGFAAHRLALDAWAERLAAASLAELPDGEWTFEDALDDDGQGHGPLPIRVRLRIRDGAVDADFDGTCAQVAGNVNCPLSVTAAAVWYLFRCLMPERMPAAMGAFRNIHVSAPQGCLVNARGPAAVSAGNVETSMRIVDVVQGALAQALPERVPAASQGTMNNVAMGHAGPPRWDYYETMAGGLGGGPDGPGVSGRQSHMTNTLNTPVESLELHYPLRITRYGLRRGSGGAGRHAGGDGVVRGFRFLAPATVTLLTERRRSGPWGLAGGAAGQPGVNRLNGATLPGKVALEVQPGDELLVESPGGGGWGDAG